MAVHRHHHDHDHRGGRRHAAAAGAPGPAAHHATHAAEVVSVDNERRVLWALVLTAGFMLAEIVGGLLSGSLALLADAGHMLTDTAALGLSWYAFRVGRRPATDRRSYGHDRLQVLAALINAGLLLGISAWIAFEAARRLLAPEPVLGGPMLVVASLGLVVNVAAFLVLGGGASENLNVRGAALHVLGDLAGSVAAMVAAGVILLTGWTPIDPLLSVLVVLLIVRGAWELIGRSWHVLMEGTPEGLDVARLRRELVEAVPGVVDVHHVHAWSLTPERPLVTLHAGIAAEADHDAVLHQVQLVLAERFELLHATVQLERDRCTDDERAAAGRQPC
jgi:cobalt-zinc-cadmium efflux system protein